MPPTYIEAPANMEKYTEAQWQNQVIHALGWYGWLHIHIRAMIGNRSGIPDLLCFRGEQGLLLELKTMHGKVGVAQSIFIAEAHSKGTEVHILRPCPEDWEKLLRLIA
jgi:VRR-NUC domain